MKRHWTLTSFQSSAYHPVHTFHIISCFHHLHTISLFKYRVLSTSSCTSKFYNQDAKILPDTLVGHSERNQLNTQRHNVYLMMLECTAYVDHSSAMLRISIHEIPSPNVGLEASKWGSRMLTLPAISAVCASAALSILCLTQAVCLSKLFRLLISCYSLRRRMQKYLNTDCTV